MKRAEHPHTGWIKRDIDRDREDALARLSMRLFLRATPLMYEGKRVGKWTLIELRPSTRKTKNHNSFWLSRCDCGAETLIRVDVLKTKTCQRCK